MWLPTLSFQNVFSPFLLLCSVPQSISKVFSTSFGIGNPCLSLSSVLLIPCIVQISNNNAICGGLQENVHHRLRYLNYWPIVVCMLEGVMEHVGCGAWSKLLQFIASPHLCFMFIVEDGIIQLPTTATRCNVSPTIIDSPSEFISQSQLFIKLSSIMVFLYSSGKVIVLGVLLL